MRRALAALAVITATAGPVLAQTGPGSSDIVARAALAALGVAALPGDGSSTLSIFGAEGDETDFFSTRIGGGVDLPRDPRLHVEGYLAYQNYAPIFVLPTPDPTFIDVRWSSVAFTGGLGWNVDLAEGLVLRPAALATLGHVFGEAIFDGLLPAAARTGLTDPFDDGLFAGGLGASLALDYDHEIGGGALDLRARQSWMKLVPLGEPDRLGVSSIASATNLFGRYTRPFAGHDDLSGVAEASYTHFWGDQSRILRTDWLATVGAGVEVALPEATLAGIGAGRVTLRYVFGDGYDGVSLGVGVSF